MNDIKTYTWDEVVSAPDGSVFVRVDGHPDSNIIVKDVRHLTNRTWFINTEKGAHTRLQIQSADVQYWQRFRFQLVPNIAAQFRAEFKVSVPPIRVTLSDDYTATITDKEVIVGCQTYSFEKIEEVVQAIAAQKLAFAAAVNKS